MTYSGLSCWMHATLGPTYNAKLFLRIIGVTKTTIDAVHSIKKSTKCLSFVWWFGLYSIYNKFTAVIWGYWKWSLEYISVHINHSPIQVWGFIPVIIPREHRLYLITDNLYYHFVLQNYRNISYHRCTWKLNGSNLCPRNTYSWREVPHFTDTLPELALCLGNGAMWLLIHAIEWDYLLLP